MLLRLLLLLSVSSTLLLPSCGSSRPKTMELQLNSKPSGARVFISRRGESTYQGKVGFIKGAVKAKAFEDEMQLIGTTPVHYSSPLTETTTDATVLGVGGRVIRNYNDAILRFERPGYETVEQFVRIAAGRGGFNVVLPPLPDSAPAPAQAQGTGGDQP